MLKMLAVTACVVFFLLVAKFLDRLVREIATRRSISALRVGYVSKISRFALMFCTVAVICLILGWGYGDIALFLSSVFAVVGIALFAQWSILSNITASVIIFFAFPYRVGDRIRVLDPDFNITGMISEIGTFHVLIRLDDGNTVTYPNTMMLQKAVLKITHGEHWPVPADAEGSEHY